MSKIVVLFSVNFQRTDGFDSFELNINMYSVKRFYL